MADFDYSNEADGNSANTNNVIVGTDGDDNIIAGPADEQYWTQQNGNLKVVQDNDTITESSGTNVLTGGYGNDSFVFNIGLTSTTSTQTVEYLGGAHPLDGLITANANGQWNSYLSNLADWRAEMVALYGADADTTTESASWQYSQGKTLKSGSAEYDDSFSYTSTQTTTNESYNTITDWGNGDDSIVMAGVTEAAFFAAGGTIAFDGTNTVIHVGTFTIVVNGAELTAANLTWG
ncbi:MAG: hypothetical protein Q8M19_24680 [Reyranella sp.]|nr:hypothetical protein [Reyranella sp.]